MLQSNLIKESPVFFTLDQIKHALDLLFFLIYLFEPIVFFDKRVPFVNFDETKTLYVGDAVLAKRVISILKLISLNADILILCEQRSHPLLDHIWRFIILLHFSAFWITHLYFLRNKKHALFVLWRSWCSLWLYKNIKTVLVFYHTVFAVVSRADFTMKFIRTGLQKLAARETEVTARILCANSTISTYSRGDLAFSIFRILIDT